MGSLFLVAVSFAVAMETGAEEGRGEEKGWGGSSEEEKTVFEEQVGVVARDSVLFVASSNSMNSFAVSSRSERRDWRRIEAQRVASVVGGGGVGVGEAGTMSVMLLS